MKLSFFLLSFFISIASSGQDSTKTICLQQDDSPEGIQKAIKYYKNQILKSSGDQVAYYSLGMCYYRLLKFKEAIPYFDQLVLLNPNYNSAFSNRGICKLFSKDKNGACEDFKKSVDIGQDIDDFNGMKLSAYIKINCSVK